MSELLTERERAWLARELAKPENADILDHLLEGLAEIAREAAATPTAPEQKPSTNSEEGTKR